MSESVRSLQPGTSYDVTEVFIDATAAKVFLDAAVCTYDQVAALRPLPCFAIVAGWTTADSAHVVRAYLAKNVRRTSAVASAEFEECVIPQFGEAYRNTCRGFWCDPADLLRISRAAEAENFDLLGSVHMHPDFHHFQPRSVPTARLSERPTPMDAYMFRNTGWPVNLICYLERSAGHLYHTWSAWAPEPDGSGAGYVRLVTRLEVGPGSGCAVPLQERRPEGASV